MTILVGLALDPRGRAALGLGTVLARSGGMDLVVGVVLVTRWPTDPSVPDEEFRELMRSVADTALQQARTQLPTDVDASFVMTEARSVPSGLLALAAEHSADLVVLGSSSTGMFGRVALGSATDRLLHSSVLPVAVATRGYHAAAGARIERISVAFGGGSSTSLLVAAATLAHRVGATLRVVRFAVSPPALYAGAPPPAQGRSVESLVLDAALRRSQDALDAALHAVQGLPEPPPGVETVIARGYSWDEAYECLPWRQGDILAIGSSNAGVGARVFLGSTGSRILRHSPVPVVVVPYEVADELADAALS